MANRRLLDSSNQVAATIPIGGTTTTTTTTTTTNARFTSQKALFLSLALVSCLISINCASFGRRLVNDEENQTNNNWRHQPDYSNLISTTSGKARLIENQNSQPLLKSSPLSSSSSLSLDDNQLYSNNLFDELLEPNYYSHSIQSSSRQGQQQFLTKQQQRQQSLADNILAERQQQQQPTRYQLVNLVEFQPDRQQQQQPVYARDTSANSFDSSANSNQLAQLLSGSSQQVAADIEQSNNNNQKLLTANSQYALGDDDDDAAAAANELLTDPRVSLFFQQLDQSRELPAEIDDKNSLELIHEPELVNGAGGATHQQTGTSNEGDKIKDNQSLLLNRDNSEQRAANLTTLIEDDDDQQQQLQVTPTAATAPTKQEQKGADITDNIITPVKPIVSHSMSDGDNHVSYSHPSNISANNSSSWGSLIGNLYKNVTSYLPSWSTLFGGSRGSQKMTNDQSVFIKHFDQPTVTPTNAKNVVQKTGEGLNLELKSDQVKSGNGDHVNNSFNQDNRLDTKPSVSSSLIEPTTNQQEKPNQSSTQSLVGIEQQQQQTDDKLNSDKDDDEQQDSKKQLSTNSDKISESEDNFQASESSPVGTFLTSELDSAKVVNSIGGNGNSDGVQIATNDKQDSLSLSSGGDANKRNKEPLIEQQQQQQQQVSTNGGVGIKEEEFGQKITEPVQQHAHKVSLLRHSGLVLPFRGNDEILVHSSQPSHSDSLLGKYIYAPTTSEHHYFNFIPTTSKVSSDDEYMQMSHRSTYSRRLHPDDDDGDNYTPFVSLRRTGDGTLGIIAQKSNDVYFLVMVAAFCIMAMAVVLAAGLFAYRVQQNRKSTTESDYPTYGVVGPNNMNGKCGAASFVGGYFASNTATGGGGAGPGSTGSSASKSGSGKHLPDLYSVSGDSGITVANGSIISSKQQQQQSNGKRANQQQQGCANNSSGGNANDQISRATPNFMANQNAARMYHYQHQKQQMIISDHASTGRHTSASDLDSEDENDDGSYTVYECPGLASAHEMEIKNPLFNDDRTP